jgi:serine-type D-Ala-D-Ala carboxypeptidase (penicillin-binding protein 5/6)
LRLKWPAVLLLILPLLLASAPPPATALGPAANQPSFGASAVAILDETGALVYGKDPHERYAMASLTKTMTALVALERIDVNQRVVVDVTWDEIPDSSIMGLALMEELTIKDLLYGLMLPSGNDAARAIARAVSGDEYRFAKLMTAKARELGMYNTQYKNPHGMDEEGHYSTAYDQALLGMYAMHNPVLAEVVDTRRITIRGRGIYPLRNINRVLDTFPGCDGIKTGFTDNARAAVVATAVQDGRRAYVGVLHTWDYATDATNLLYYYFDNYSVLAPIEAPRAAAPVSPTS